MTQDCSDEELMLKYQQGDPRAFDTLYAKYKRPVYSFMLKQISNRTLCDELYQDVWMNVIHSRQNYSNTGSFKAYLFQISRNRLVDYYRSDKSATVDPDTDVDDIIDDKDSDAVNSVEQDRRLKQIQKLLLDLPREQREVFLLKEYGGLGLAEIAEISAEKIETVKSRLRYAFKKIRQGVEYD